MTKFRSPRRRGTRQRSGQHTSGETTGGQCKLRVPKLLEVPSNSLSLTFERHKVKLVPSFNRKLAFVALGGYVKPSTTVNVQARLWYLENDQPLQESQSEHSLDPNKWSKFGTHSIFDIRKLTSATGELSATIRVESPHEIGRLEFFGFELDAVRYYESKGDLWDRFNQKTQLYLPEIYYFDSDTPFSVMPKESLRFQDGNCVVLKSCNRCSRYLLIDLENERSAISFSNHCTSRAPCRHQLFSTYGVVENECGHLPTYILRHRTGADRSQSSLLNQEQVTSHIRTRFGYQLECRSCKKFYVNAPLNPMRDSTQHREDSLRRRAVEVLVDQLLDRGWVYHSWRLKRGKEFDVEIWERFGKRCFNCGKTLERPEAMDLDHTLPLAFLWPLDETATCLCPTCNSQKRDRFPIDFYSVQKLDELSRITGLSQELMRSRSVNRNALNILLERIVWFFDEFLMDSDYQKIRGGKKTSDLICKAVQAALDATETQIDLVHEYQRKTGRPPPSITFGEA